MKKIEFRIAVIILITLSSIYGCGKDKTKVEEPQPIANEPELITTVRLVVKDSASGNVFGTFTFKDPDGDGGLKYTIFDTLKLNANASYLVDLVLLNEATSPTDTISNEVKEEANDHLVCMTPSVTNLSVLKLDKDGNNLPIGLKTAWMTKAAGNGTLKVSLKHQPGIKTGDCGIGETDVEVNFPLVIK